MITYQDFETAADRIEMLQRIISEHKASALYSTALSADEYDHQRNESIINFVRELYNARGTRLTDYTASNNRICSNFFRRLNTQRCTYSLGNGLTFKSDRIKKQLGNRFDTTINDAGYKALIHGVSFCFWNYDRLYVFPVTEFAPLWDEETGALRAGVRFWRLAPEKPMFAALYEETGYTKYRAEKDGNRLVPETDKPVPYKQQIRTTPADGVEVVGGDNYSSLPIVPLWGSKLRQSTLVGMRSGIDSYDLIRSGYANDLTDCAEVYWIVENYGGMEAKDLEQFRDRLKLLHIAAADTSDGGKVTPYTQEIPYQARADYLDRIRSGIYEDFGGLDVHTIAAGATNDHIDAAYQPLDENADDFEYQVIECVQQILALQGIEDSPTFKRNRVSNVKEQVEVLMLEAPYLDDETILNHCPNISPDEVKVIMARKDADDLEKFKNPQAGGEPNLDEVIDDA